MVDDDEDDDRAFTDVTIACITRVCMRLFEYGSLMLSAARKERKGER